jgi:hypothetical protein
MCFVVLQDLLLILLLLLRRRRHLLLLLLPSGPSANAPDTPQP